MIEVMGRGWTMPCASASEVARRRGNERGGEKQGCEVTSEKMSNRKSISKKEKKEVQNDTPIPRMKNQNHGTRYTALTPLLNLVYLPRIGSTRWNATQCHATSISQSASLARSTRRLAGRLADARALTDPDQIPRGEPYDQIQPPPLLPRPPLSRARTDFGKLIDGVTSDITGEPHPHDRFPHLGLRVQEEPDQCSAGVDKGPVCRGWGVAARRGGGEMGGHEEGGVEVRGGVDETGEGLVGAYTGDEG